VRCAPCFFLRRQLGQGYLDLLQFFLNRRTYARSERPERVGRSPAELMTGKRHPHWLELPGFERFRRAPAITYPQPEPNERGACDAPPRAAPPHKPREHHGENECTDEHRDARERDPRRGSKKTVTRRASDGVRDALYPGTHRGVTSNGTRNSAKPSSLVDEQEFSSINSSAWNRRKPPTSGF